MNNDSEIPGTKNRRFTWPLIAVGLLAGHATLIITAVCLAVGGTGRGVVPDYYQKAVQYDQHKAERANSAQLGWRLDTVVSPRVNQAGHRRVEIQAFDANGEALTHLFIQAEFIQQANGHVVNLVAEPAPQRPGVYVSSAKLPDAGWYRLIARADSPSHLQRFVFEQDVQLHGPTQISATNDKGNR